MSVIETMVMPFSNERTKRHGSYCSGVQADLHLVVCLQMVKLDSSQRISVILRQAMHSVAFCHYDELCFPFKGLNCRSFGVSTHASQKVITSSHCAKSVSSKIEAKQRPIT